MQLVDTYVVGDYGITRRSYATVQIFESADAQRCRAIVHMGGTQRSKTKSGETAWCDVRRWADDMATKFVHDGEVA
jgi:hypothetical protein